MKYLLLFLHPLNMNSPRPSPAPWTGTTLLSACLCGRDCSGTSCACTWTVPGLCVRRISLSTVTSRRHGRVTSPVKAGWLFIVGRDPTWLTFICPWPLGLLPPRSSREDGCSGHAAPMSPQGPACVLLRAHPEGVSVQSVFSGCGQCGTGLFPRDQLVADFPPRAALLS